MQVEPTLDVRVVDKKLTLELYKEILNVAPDLHMMISISTARAGKGSCEWLETYDKEWLNSYKKSYEATKVSNGPMNNFPTYCLKWPKIQ